MKMLIEQYLSSLAALNNSEHTLRAYRRTLLEFAQHFGDDLQQVTRENYRALLAALATRLGRSSQVQARAIHRAFFKWLEVEGVLTAELNTVANMKPLRREKHLARVPSVAEVAALLDGPLLGSAWPERDRVMLELFYNTGCREAELVAVDVEDVLGDRVLLKGKGRKERLVPLYDATMQALAAYMPSRVDHLRGTECSALFISAAQRERLTVRSVHRIVKGIGVAYGIPWLHPHAFRHAFATHMVDAGADESAVQQILGHSRLETTMTYSGSATTRAFAEYAQALA